MFDFNIDFGLNDNDIEEFREVIKSNEQFLCIRLVNHGGRCPQCGTFTKCVKEYKLHKIDHAVYIDRKSSIIYYARRFICPRCRKTFYEENPFSSEYTFLFLIRSIALSQL